VIKDIAELVAEAMSLREIPITKFQDPNNNPCLPAGRNDQITIPKQ
jgi:hypothetical protein